MATEVVGWRLEEHLTADLQHLHQVRHGDWEVEDVLKRAAVDDRIELAGILCRDWLVEVMDNRGALVRGVVDDLEGACPEKSADEVVRVAARHVAVQGSRR